ncbi:MAG: DUF2306 domain-containing protein [Alphaproteobacteria bacterium]|nr:DUF2306 domain-containing protein [Alphaproteobacteria bacterium]
MTLSRPTIWFIATTSLLVALLSYRFLALDLMQAFAGMEQHILNRKTAFLAHITASPIALVLGVLQFSSHLRRRRPRLHRLLGRLYALAILVGGVSGLIMAFGAIGGPVAGWGFGLLAVLWIGVTARAIRLAMQRRIADHRRWMMRSFALTFAAVTLRLYLPVFMASGVDYATASIYVAWLCWVPNLLIVEYVLRRETA